MGRRSGSIGDADRERKDPYQPVQKKEEREEAAEKQALAAGPHVSGMLRDPRLGHPANAGRRALLLHAGQRALGNQALQRALRPLDIRTRLAVTTADDAYEQEADRVAETVMTTPDVQRQPEEEEEEGQLQAQPLAGGVAAPVRRQAEEEEEKVQARGGLAGALEVPAGMERRIHALRGAGRPLSGAARAFFEGRLGYDFGQVRLHTGGEAAGVVHALQARAFTLGPDIAFGPGQYRPGTTEGRRLLAHELAHVVQQSGDHTAGLSRAGAGTVQRRLDWDIGQPSTPRAPTPLPPRPPQERVDEILRIRDFGSLSETERFEKLQVLLSAETGAQAIRRIWESFGDSIAQVAARHAGTWERSARLSPNLDELPALSRIKQNFERDVKGLALRYLETNRRYVTTEMERMGIGTRQITETRVVGFRGGMAASMTTMQERRTVATMTPEMTPEQAGQLEMIRGIAREVKRAQEYERALRRIPVGYRITWTRAGGDYWERRVPTNFDPDARPEVAPTGTESPPMHTWDEARRQYDQIQAVVSGFGNRFPAIYAAIRDNRIEDLIQGTPQQARSAVAESLVNVLNNIDQTRPRIEGGGLDYRDLQPIHSQLFGGTRGASNTNWSDPFNRWVANDILSDHAAREFWIQLGLGTLAAAAFLVAELATAGSATFFIAAEVGITASVTQAGRSWDRYRNLATAAQANVSDEMALVARGQVNEALLGAILDTVGAFLDIAGVGVHIARAGRTILPEFALAGARRGAVEGLERVGQMGAEEARALINRAVSELGVEQTATRSGKSLDELIGIVGAESEVGQRIQAFRLARQAGLTGAEDLPTRLRNLAEELRPGPTGAARLTRAEADRLAVQAVEQYGPVQTLQLAGGWKKLAGALGDDSVAGRHLYTWRDSVWAETEQFITQELRGQVRRTGSQGRFSNDLDFSLLGPNASVNRDRARSFLAGRTGLSPEELDRMLACTAFTDPRRLHLYDYLSPTLREQMANEAAAFERNLIWNRRLHDARHATPPNEALATQIRNQMRELNIAESTFVPLSREDLSRLYREIDSLHQELETAVQQGNVARQQELVRDIGRRQGQINASEEGAYISGGGGREFVSERPGEATPIPSLAPGAPRLTAEQVNAVLDQLPMLDHAASGLNPARSLDELADAIKGVGKYGERLSTVASRLHLPRTAYRDAAVFDSLAERCRDLVARARGQTAVTLQQQLREDLNAVLSEVRGLSADLEVGSNQLLRTLSEQGAMPGVQNFGRIHLLTHAHVKYLRARDAIIWQLSVAVRTVRGGVAATEEGSTPGGPESRP